MLITVAVCTWNRAELLRRTLGEIARLTIPPAVEWELVIVDNNSTDHTPAVIASFADRLPLRSVFEPRPGVSHARNRVTAEARGQYIVCTDDDVNLDREWLAEYCRAFATWPDAVLFGGPIEPRFEGTPPAWARTIVERYGGVYGRRALGDAPATLAVTDNRLPYGANYAVRAAEHRRFRYDAAIGRLLDDPVRGEETRVFAAMLQSGYEGRWIPGARIWHWIPRENQTVRYLRRWFFGWGQFVDLTEPDGDGPRLLGRSRAIWRRALTAELRYRMHRLTAGPETWLRDLALASESWGRLYGYRKRSELTGVPT